MFFMFMPRASLVETEISSGLLFLKCAFAAIKTGVSVIPLASFAIVFPVQGNSTRMSSRLCGPIGSASEMVRMGFRPVISSACCKNAFGDPKRLSIVCAELEKIVCTMAPSSVSFLSCANTFS